MNQRDMFVRKVNKIFRLFGDNAFLSSKAKKFEGDYSYPYQNATISEHLKDDKYSDLMDLFEDRDSEFIAQLEKFRSIIPTSPINPSKKWRDFEYFIAPDSFDAFNCIFKYKSEPALNKTIIFRGPKGSGKTAYQNYWLLTNNNLLEDNNIFWVRCDCAKLYDQWVKSLENIANIESTRERVNIVTLEEYLKMQFLYVFSKYFREDDRPLFKRIYKLIKTKNLVFKKRTNYDEPKSFESVLMCDYIDQLNTSIKLHETSHKGSYVIDVVMKQSMYTRGREKMRWLDCSDDLIQFIQEQGVWLFYIVDGVDNVHMNNKSSVPYYRRMLVELFDFIKKLSNRNELRLVATRNRTLIDVDLDPRFPQTASFRQKRKVIDHLPPIDESKILKKRLEWFEENEYQGKNKFCSIARSVMDSTDIFKGKIFHNNIRNYLHNCSTLIALIKYRMDQTDASGIRYQAEQHKKRNLFLNGRLFLKTKEDWPEMNNEEGLPLFNIFFINNSKYPCNSHAKWLGLGRIRLLDVLDQNENGITEKQLREFMSAGFGYKDEFVEYVILDSRAFGWIDSCTDGSDCEIKYVISDLGKYIIRDILQDLDCIYFFALDALLPSNAINQGLILAHNNKLHQRSLYRSSLAATVVYFVFMVLLVDSYEEQYLKSQQNILEGAINYKSFFSRFKFRENVQNEIVNLINDFDDSDVVQFEQYLDDFSNYFEI